MQRQWALALSGEGGSLKLVLFANDEGAVEDSWTECFLIRGEDETYLGAEDGRRILGGLRAQLQNTGPPTHGRGIWTECAHGHDAISSVAWHLCRASWP